MADFSALQGRPCPAWYAEPQLGIFIHWGIFAIPAWAPRGESIAELTRTNYDEVMAISPYAEWYSNALRVPGSPTQRHHAEVWGDRTYESFRDDFERAAEAFDAGAWADLFAEAGAGYVVFVTKHHDGFCLWPTEVENPHRPGWHSRRDFVGELAEAVRARGMRFGLYYSGGLDWTFKPAPIRNVGDMFACVPTTADYKAYAEAQVRELIARYRPSVLWNDIAWPDKEQLPALFADYYAAVPDGVVNDRWLGETGFFESLADPAVRHAFNERTKAREARAEERPAKPPPHCDFRTVEYGSGKGMEGQKWESTRGLGLAFGYNANERDEDYMTSEALIALYDDVTSRGGNLLINVGPKADASILAQQATPLKALGRRIKAPDLSWRRFPRVYVDGRPIDANDGAMTEIAPLARQRRFVTPRPDETLEALAARALPDAPLEAAMEQIRAWNLHVFAMRKPRGLLLGSDVIFVEPPLA